MKFTRKNFLKTGAVLAGGLVFQSNKVLSALQNQSSGFKAVRGNFGIYNERGGTIGWFANGDVLIVADSQFPDTAKNFMDGIKKKVDRKIDLLFNTHHHGDHTSGNIYLKDSASMIAAHENSKALQRKFYGNDSSKPQTYPTVTFADEWTLDLGKEKVWAKHFCPAHTGGDAIIHFQNTNVVHMGDIVFNKVFPYIDLPGGASLHKWIEFIEKSVPVFDRDTLYIFGHAQSQETCIGKSDDVYAMRDYLSVLINFVSKEIKEGKNKEQIASASEIPGVKDIKEQRDGIRKMNLEKAYEYLTQKIDSNND